MLEIETNDAPAHLSSRDRDIQARELASDDPPL